MRWAGEDIAGRQGFDKAWLAYDFRDAAGEILQAEKEGLTRRGLLNELRDASGEDIEGRKEFDNAWLVYDLRDAAGKYCGPKRRFDKRRLLNEFRDASGEDIEGRKGFDKASIVMISEGRWQAEKKRLAKRKKRHTSRPPLLII